MNCCNHASPQEWCWAVMRFIEAMHDKTASQRTNMFATCNTYLTKQWSFSSSNQDVLVQSFFPQCGETLFTVPYGHNVEEYDKSPVFGYWWVMEGHQTVHPSQSQPRPLQHTALFAAPASQLSLHLTPGEKKICSFFHADCKLSCSSFIKHLSPFPTSYLLNGALQRDIWLLDFAI